jgi:hypothetical protein
MFYSVSPETSNFRDTDHSHMMQSINDQTNGPSYDLFKTLLQ